MRSKQRWWAVLRSSALDRPAQRPAARPHSPRCALHGVARDPAPARLHLRATRCACKQACCLPPLPAACRSRSPPAPVFLACRLKGKQPPEGWELIEEVVEDFEHQMKEAVNEDTSGKRRNETTWKVRPAHACGHPRCPLAAGAKGRGCHHAGGSSALVCLLIPRTPWCWLQITRIHWEKNRFIFDLMYNRKARWGCAGELARPAAAGLRPRELRVPGHLPSTPWPPFHTHPHAHLPPTPRHAPLLQTEQVMSRELYDWLVREKIADGALIAKWRKPGYEILCSLLAIQKGNHNFGTTSHCRVPMRQRAAQQRVTPDVQTGCVCCASGDGRFGCVVCCGC